METAGALVWAFVICFSHQFTTLKPSSNDSAFLFSGNWGTLLSDNIKSPARKKVNLVNRTVNLPCTQMTFQSCKYLKKNDLSF